jgi:hypothetical protein
MEVVMYRIASRFTVAMLMGAGLLLSACGDTQLERAGSGAAIGAGTGAVGAAVTGGSATTGAVVGGVAGAAAGALLKKDQVDLDN